MITFNYINEYVTLAETHPTTVWCVLMGTRVK
jgi:hypothetical protein